MPSGTKVFQADTFSGKCFYEFSEGLLLGYCKCNIVRSREPPSSAPTQSLQKESTAGIYRTIFQLDLGIMPPSLTYHQKGGSVAPSVTLELLAQPHWAA